MARGADKPASDPTGDSVPPADARRRATRVRAGALAAALRDVIGVVESRNTIPILAHVMISAGDGRIELTATDLDLWATRELASDDRDGPGSDEWIKGIRAFAITLPAKPLAAVIGELDADAMVTLTAPDLAAKGAATGPATIAAGRSRFRLNALAAAEFPMPPRLTAAATMDLPCSQLADAFAAVEHAISTEEARYYLNGIYVHPHALDLRMATTDGHRLARLTIDAPDGGASFPAAIISRRTVALLDKVLAGAIKAAGENASPPAVLVEAAGAEPGNLLRFSLPAGDGGSLEIVAKTIDGSFPDYERVIPASTPRVAIIDRAKLSEAVKRVSVLADSKSRAVKAEFSADLLRLSVTTAEIGDAVEELACSWEPAAGESEPFTVGFDGRYWRDALGALASDTVAMGFTDPGGPAVIRAVSGTDGSTSERLVQVLMPLRV